MAGLVAMRFGFRRADVEVQAQYLGNGRWQLSNGWTGDTNDVGHAIATAIGGGDIDLFVDGARVGWIHGEVYNTPSSIGRGGSLSERVLLALSALGRHAVPTPVSTQSPLRFPEQLSVAALAAVTDREAWRVTLQDAIEARLDETAEPWQQVAEVMAWLNVLGHGLGVYDENGSTWQLWMGVAVSIQVSREPFVTPDIAVAFRVS